MNSSDIREDPEVVEVQQLANEELDLISAAGDPDDGGQIRLLRQRAR